MSGFPIEPAYAAYVAERSELRAEFDAIQEQLEDFIQLLWDYVEPHPSTEEVQGMEGTAQHSVAHAVNDVQRGWSMMLYGIGTLVDACEARRLPGQDWGSNVRRQ